MGDWPQEEGKVKLQQGRQVPREGFGQMLPVKIGIFMPGIPMGTGVEVTEMRKPCAWDQSDDLGSRPHVSTF